MTQCRNLISDVPGLRVGNAHDADLCSGVTAVIFERPLITAMDVRGGGPGTRRERCRRIGRLPRGGARARALWWIGVRAFRRNWRAELARRAGHGLRHRRSARAHRSAGRIVRSSERREQELGREPTLRKTGQAGVRSGGARLRARKRGRGLRSDDGDAARRPWERLGDTRERSRRGCARRRQRGRHRDDRRHAPFLGGAI